MLLLSAALLVFSVPTNAAYENTHINTGDALEDIISVAVTQLGYMEGSLEGTVQKQDDVTKYGEWYGMNGQPWCAMFVSWCANQANIPTTIIPKHASCDVGMQWFINKGLFEYSDYYGGSYEPKRGDIVYFGYRMSSGDFDSNHVGIVYKIENAKIYVYEGNSSAKVQSVSYKLSQNAYILGYGKPEYNNQEAASTGYYKVNTAWLNFRAEPNTSAQKFELLEKDTLLKITEISENGWGKTEYNGNTGWLSLEYCRKVFEISYEGEDTVNLPDPQYKESKQDITLSTLIPLKGTSKFLGWALAPGTEAVYAPGDSYMKDKDIVLYAVFDTEELVKSYTVSYDANGGTNAPASQIKTENKELILSTQIPVYEGYEFLGWALDKTGNAVYAPGGKYTENKNITLYARWKAVAVISEYTVKYDANGGTNPPPSQKKTETEDLILSSLTPVRTGYSFEGWAYTKDSKWADLLPGDSYTNNKDITLYALWTKNISGVSIVCHEGGRITKYIDSNTVYIRVRADEGFAISLISVDSKPLALIGDTTETTFTLDISVSKKAEICFTDNSGLWINPFEDVANTAWYYDSVKFCYENGLMMGTSDTAFVPDKKLTRGEFVTIMGRIYEKSGGVIACNTPPPFTDISDNAYYYTYLCWAYNNKIVSGISDTKFAPAVTLTREQLCMMLFNYSAFNGDTGSYNQTLIYAYKDHSAISSWAAQAVAWAVDRRVISGSSGKLLPRDTATRAQAATVIMNYFK